MIWVFSVFVFSWDALGVSGGQVADALRLEQFILQEKASSLPNTVPIQGSPRFYLMADRLDITYTGPCPIPISEGYYAAVGKILDCATVAADRGQSVEGRVTVIPERTALPVGQLMSAYFWYLFSVFIVCSLCLL